MPAAEDKELLGVDALDAEPFRIHAALQIHQQDIATVPLHLSNGTCHEGGFASLVGPVENGVSAAEHATAELVDLPDPEGLGLDLRFRRARLEDPRVRIRFLDLPQDLLWGLPGAGLGFLLLL